MPLFFHCVQVIFGCGRTLRRLGRVLASPQWLGRVTRRVPAKITPANIFSVLVSQALDAVLKPGLFISAFAARSDSAPRQTRRQRGKRPLGRPAIIVLAEPRSGSEKEKRTAVPRPGCLIYMHDFASRPIRARVFRALRGRGGARHRRCPFVPPSLRATFVIGKRGFRRKGGDI